MTLAATLITVPAIAGSRHELAAQEVAAVKAAFLYNFAKFTEWPALPPGLPIVFCVVGDEGIATALAHTVRGQNVNDHPLDVSRPQDSATWRVCQLLFIAEAEARRSAGGLSRIKTLPVLTVSDGKDFIEAGGIIELYVESGRMRFAINANAAELRGLRLSSRLLGLATIKGTGDEE
jgi:hypothetical protein